MLVEEPPHQGNLHQAQSLNPGMPKLMEIKVRAMGRQVTNPGKALKTKIHNT
jgi:hypothetical protein